MAQIIDGKALAKQVRREVKVRSTELQERGVQPGLAVVLVGDDPASAVYVKGKTRACKRTGIAHFDHKLPATTTQTELLELVESLNADPAVHGILVQLPLPAQIDEATIIRAITPCKDVDGFHPVSMGNLMTGSATFAPCTPLGVMRMLQHTETPLQGAEAVIVGRSNIVGKPMAMLLLEQHATVTLCHSRTRDLGEVVSRADVVVAAVGVAELIKGAWIKPGATVIDVGINRGADDKLVGDVEFEAAAERARAISPVPGGVGPMTIALLMQNTAEAAARTLED
jgi:methylenetetrahydrofolate dehydrogenase (NADP+)/methenyltetrahydrofolate cyclohydrolase